MRYIGSKRLLSKKLLPLMIEDINFSFCYVEPFMGGCNMLDKINHPHRIGNDINHYIVAMWQALQDGWIPPDSFTKEEYETLKKNPEKYPPELVGFIGTGCAYSGSWFDGYANSLNSRGEPRNYCAESKRNVLKQLNNLKDVIFVSQDYRTLDLPSNSFIYCDPPYKSVKYYRYSSKFDTTAFWNWAIEQSDKGHIVYVSEYEAPDDSRIKTIDTFETKVYANITKVKKATEKLFKILNKEEV